MTLRLFLTSHSHPPLPLPARHGVQQGDVIRPVEVRVLHSVHEVHELHPGRRRGEEGDGGVQAAADGGSEATGREQTDQGTFCSPHVNSASPPPPTPGKVVQHVRRSDVLIMGLVYTFLS